MRISFTGAHSVGKSTLVKILRETYDDSISELCGDITYDGIGRNIINNENWSLKNKQRYLNYWYAFTHLKNVDFLSSRTVYDTWAHSRTMINPWFNHHLFSWVTKNIYYDYVFYVPIEFDIVNDGVRYIDKDLQVQIDKEIVLILNFFHIPYHSITGSVEERIIKVRSIIGI